MATAEGALDDEQEEIFAYSYGEDFPQAVTVLGSAVLGGRPTNKSLGPMQQLKIITTASEYRAPTPRKPGKGKALPASEAEGEMETKSRQDAQKACRRLIASKLKHESSDSFLRRLDASRQAPEALVAPILPPETEVHFAKRMVAIKANWEAQELPNLLVLPKSTHETEAEFEERMALCKKTKCLLVFPHGAHESGAQCKARMASQGKTRRTILPRSADEPEKMFAKRCTLQVRCETVIHPFDSKREDTHSYERRLEAHDARTALPFEPGDKRAIVAAIGEEKRVHIENAEPVDHTPVAELMKRAEESNERIHVEEEEAAAKLDEELRKEKDAEEEKAREQERLAQRLEDMKLKARQEKERAEAEANKPPPKTLEKININTIGFMPLKRLLVERGVPKEQVSAPNKFALMEVAKKWGDELMIEWVTEDPVDVS